MNTAAALAPVACPLKVVIPGGSGHLGTLLARAFHDRGDRVVVLSRDGRRAPGPFVEWDGRTPGRWIEEIDGADVVINLAGRSVDTRYDAKRREEILWSRVETTRALGAAIAAATRPPRLWLQASTATIYAHRYDAPNDELTGILGGSEPDAPEEWRFSVDVAKAWEQAVDDADTRQTRKVKMRMAMVMSTIHGGPFDALLRHVRLGFGRLGDGRQYMSWIHERDFVRAIEWLIDSEDISGAVNLAAPNPIPNAQFMRVLQSAWRGRVGVPVSGWVLDLGAWLVRTETELVLKSRRVVPRRLIDDGFTFRFPEWSAAARDLCARWKGEGGTW
jgi:uncharacterized protein (TIGR01777 family)